MIDNSLNLIKMDNIQFNNLSIPVEDMGMDTNAVPNTDGSNVNKCICAIINEHPYDISIFPNNATT